LAIAELHSDIFIALKQPLATVSSWPSAGGQFQLKINTLSERLGMSGGFY
jgi:hypothetical protein